MKSASTSSSLVRVRRIPVLPARHSEGHKGDYGRVLVVGGSLGMAGAPALAGMAALRGGAGLVTIAVPACILPTVAALCPCATTIELPATSDGQIDPVACLKIFGRRSLLARGGATPDALVVGPGLGLAPVPYGQQLWELIDAFREGGRCKAVVDADALNLAGLAGGSAPENWDCREHWSTVVTPHPGEMARLHGATTREVQADREGFAVRTARLLNARQPEAKCLSVVVLKGAGTVVTDGRRIYVNKTGNPGMATGGSGDVLSGVIAAAMGQGLDCFDAAVFGVQVHGRAGDLAVKVKGQASLIATDIIEALPAAMKGS
ncbi:MAG TPA: NAD(P)H-hydrate dehydratase [Phycisphaerae bacterium]|nr:NAD(P)H-hydrate dehydratase [Phycisphaerae bacterium]HRY67224.1 NAD(P)H-hydrate dehydratase [Phycisphaerae bacterium]HSA26406.1 NAD(P)H-hydrate dehydratase [Phycisphaerae bacterium]